MRYFENLKPGGNAGGWVDQGGMNLPNRFGEQLWLTLFAKAPEITIFNIGAIYSTARSDGGATVPDSRAARLLRDVESGEELSGQSQGAITVFETPLTRGTYRVFARL